MRGVSVVISVYHAYTIGFRPEQTVVSQLERQQMGKIL